MTKTNVIKETQNYTLQVEYSSTSPDQLCYKVKNKKYEVTEVESFILPQALKWLDDLEASLAASYDSFSTTRGVQ